MPDWLVLVLVAGAALLVGFGFGYRVGWARAPTVQLLTNGSPYGQRRER